VAFWPAGMTGVGRCPSPLPRDWLPFPGCADDQGDPGVHGGALSGIPGDGVRQVGCAVAAVCGGAPRLGRA
jgi:hypothetical protein